MPSTQKADLTPAVIQQLLLAGWSQTEIAEYHGVTRQAISFQVRKYGLYIPERKRFLEEHFPWKTTDQMAQMSPARNLRAHGEWLATKGKGMSEDKLKRLRAFYQKLRDENVVVEFDPTLPPEPGVSSQGGFAFRKRRKSDGDLLIRENEYTTLTDESRLIWRFPAVEP